MIYSWEKLFLHEAIDYLRCRYECFTHNDSHGGKMDRELILKSYPQIGMWDHEREMKLLCREYMTERKAAQK